MNSERRFNDKLPASSSQTTRPARQTRTRVGEYINTQIEYFVGDLNEGLYFITVELKDNSTQTSKLIIQR
jgi:hypothetical protein